MSSQSDYDKEAPPYKFWTNFVILVDNNSSKVLKAAARL